MSIKSNAIWAAAPTTTRGQPTILSSDPKGERIAYASNKSIFLRSIDDPSVSTQYASHTAATTVARFSPSGYYIASGDVSGLVRVWASDGENTTKGEYGIIAGRINDIAWDGDSQRIIAVGDGKERFGHCITADSGNSVGEISGHSSQINCVDVRKQRPLRAVTGSDDTQLAFFHGAPFKFNTSLRGQHQRFVFGTQFSPDGSLFASVGADKRIWLYDGKTGEPKQEIGQGIHSGSIFGVSWSKDSKRFVTASADQTVRIWDAESGQNPQTWRLGGEGSVSVPDQQVGVVWPSGRSDGLVISVDLEGNLNYLHEGSQIPTRVVRGHQKNVTAARVSGSTLVTGSYEGRVCAWDIASGTADKVEGDSHTNYVADIATEASSSASGDVVGAVTGALSSLSLSSNKSSGTLYSVGWDDTLRTISASDKKFTGTAASTSGQPKGVAAAGGIALVASPNSVDLYKDGQKAGSQALSGYQATAIAAYGDLVAVGGDDKAVHLYKLSGTSLAEASIQPSRKATAAISTLAFSADGSKLAAGVSNGKIMVFSPSDGSVVTDRWSAHTARITSIAWHPTGEYAVSGSLDTAVMIWSLKEPGKRIKALNAHKDGVNGVAWIEGNQVLSTGGDATVKVWKVEP